MVRGSTSLLRATGFVTFLLSIPILGGGVWLAARANSTDCLRFLQWPLLAIGLAVMAVSLVGFAGACYRVACLLRAYLFSMFLLVVALLGLVVFAYAVTDRGRGQVVLGRAFLEYQFSDYSGSWLSDRVADPGYWAGIRACLRERRRACAGMRRYGRDPITGVLVPEPAEMFYRRPLSPIESGCCKPPASCGYAYVNETYWDSAAAGTGVSDADCLRWSNNQQQLCFQCGSCRAGVLASVRRSWRRVSVINAVVVVALVVFLVAGCAGYRSARGLENDDERFREIWSRKPWPSRSHL